MKLYLSSYRIPTPSKLEKLLGKPLRDCKTVIIPNAKDYNPPEERTQKLNDLTNDLASLGLKADIADLRDYDGQEQLLNKLKIYDLIWVAGGNTYVLRSEMRRSGFDRIIQELLMAGIVYGGESAGAIAAGPSLKGFEGADDPSLAPEIISAGLGLTGKIIAPHMDSSDFREYAQHIKEYYDGDERAVYLNDNQALIVNGDNQAITTGTATAKS